MMRGRSSCWRQRSSSLSLLKPSPVIGTLSISFNLSCPDAASATRAGHRFPTAKHKKKTVRELRLPEPLHLIRINIASFARFSRQKLACRRRSRDDRTAKRSHRIVTGPFARRAHRAGFAACSRRSPDLIRGHESRRQAHADPGSPGGVRDARRDLPAFAETQQLDAGGIAVDAETIADGLRASLGPGIPAGRRRDRHRAPGPHAADRGRQGLRTRRRRARGRRARPGRAARRGDRPRFRASPARSSSPIPSRATAARAPRSPAQGWSATAGAARLDDLEGHLPDGEEDARPASFRLARRGHAGRRR